MKIVVIGGSGLIGKKLVNDLCQHGHEVAAAHPLRASTPSLARDWLKRLLGSNPTHGSGWIFQILSTMSHVYGVLNPTNGSWWMVQILSTQNRFSV
jgi:hypothetical protein